MGRLKLGVLISGRGSNLQSIIDACKDKNFPAQIEIVIANNTDAYGMKRARQANLRTAIIAHKDFSTKSLFEQALKNELDKYQLDLICLAGFMRILSADFINPYLGKIINIHPSLLPKYKGLNTHQKALEAEDTMSGCTVHYVIPEMDEGPIILQKQVPILSNETVETLAAKILAQEHVAYPEAIRLIAEKRVEFSQ